MTSMTKGERGDLQRLVRQREKAMKSGAKLRSTELLADFENQLASEFRFDDDAVWAEAAKEAQTEIDRAQKRIAARCQELGIPDRFAPSLQLLWCNRGYDNLLDKRRNELRHVAQARVAAIEQDAVVKIELASIEAQTEIATAGLESDAARAFVAKLRQDTDGAHRGGRHGNRPAAARHRHAGAAQGLALQSRGTPRGTRAPSRRAIFSSRQPQS